MEIPSPPREAAVARRPWGKAAFFLSLLALLCALRWPLQQRPIHDVDESVSALIAIDWLEGGVPYRDAIDQRGPVTYALYALAFLVAGKGNMAAVYGLLILVIWSGAALAWRFAPELASPPGEAQERAGPAVGYLAAVLVALGSVSYRRTQMMAFHTEWPLVVLSTLGMMLLWWGLTRAEGRRLWLAGMAFGAAFLSKQPAVFDGLASGLFLFAWQWRQGRLLSRETLQRAVALAGGFFAVLAACLAYFAAHGALGDFYLYFWSYNVEHYTAVVPLAKRLRGLNPFVFHRHFLTANPLFFATTVVGVLSAELALVRRGRQAVDGRLLVALWALAAYFGASYSGRNFGHYFIQMLVPASLLAALVLRGLWRASRRAAWQPALVWAARGLLIAATVSAVAYPLHRFRGNLSLLSRDRNVARKVHQDRLVAYLREHTAAADRVFVWGYNPEVYLFAERRPASRYSNTNYLTGMLPWENHQRRVDTSEHIVPGAMEVLLAELEAAPAAVFVDSVPGNHRFYRKYPIRDFPPLAAYLAAHYRKETTIRDRKGRPYYDVYRRLPG